MIDWGWRSWGKWGSLGLGGVNWIGVGGVVGERGRGMGIVMSNLRGDWRWGSFMTMVWRRINLMTITLSKIQLHNARHNQTHKNQPQKTTKTPKIKTNPNPKMTNILTNKPHS